MNTKARKSMSVILLIIAMMLLSSTSASCVYQTKPVELSPTSSDQPEVAYSSDFIVPHGDTAENKVRLTNGEWPPYLSEGMEHYGVASRIVTEAFVSEGVEVEYDFFPWKRAYELAKSGEWDGSVVWFRTAEREKDFYFSNPVVQSHFVFWHLKSFDFDRETAEDLQSVIIGATRGYFYEDLFSSLEKAGKAKVEWVSSDEQNFMKLLAGRIDLCPLDINVGNSMQKNLALEERELLTYHPQPLRTDDLCLILSRQVKGNERLLTLFNRGLKRLRESGKLEKYMSEAIGNE